jgi:hypothetical protein
MPFAAGLGAILLASAALAGLTETGSRFAVSFANMAHRAGLTMLDVCGSETHKKYILEMNGSGVAFIDYNRDGFPDLFVVNGTQFGLKAGNSLPTSHLYRNNKDGTFTDVTRAAGMTYTGWGQGACVGDFDNDGWDDLFVTYYGRNRLYHNNGDGTFTDVAGQAGVAGAEGRWNSGCAFVDYDRDGKLDLFVTNYVDLGADLSGTPAPGSGEFCQYKGVPIACGPRGLKPGLNYLFHNEGGGRFRDVSVTSGIRQTEGHYGLGVLTLDYDNDGWPDIYVADDSAASILYHNQHDGTFRDVGFASGTAFNDDGEPQAGMGVAAADYNHDGWLDIVKTNFSDDSPNLYRNNGHGSFGDRVFEAGLGRIRSYLGWGVLFLDVDNDGWPDILSVNGHLSPEIEAAGSDSRFKQKKLLYRNLGNGRFDDISARAGPAFAELHSSRGAAAADLLNDGRMAIAVNELSEMPSLLMLKEQPANHWIGIRTIGMKSNRDGIGARVEVWTVGIKQMEEVRSGGSYLSQNDLRLHFGLGAARTVDEVHIRWPSGHADVLKNIPADQQVVIEEGSGAWKPQRSK